MTERSFLFLGGIIVGAIAALALSSANLQILAVMGCFTGIIYLAYEWKRGLI